MKRLALAGLALALGGCAVGPDYVRPALELPAQYPALPGEAAGESATPDRWWTLYGDATLDRLVDEALARNADVELAVARVAEAQANLREAGATLLPEFGASLAGTRSRVSAATAFPNQAPLVRNDVRAAFTTSFELDFWGRLRRGREAVAASALGTRFARDVVRLSVAGLVAQSYFTLRSLDGQVGLARGSLAAREESLGVAQARARAGLASDLDVNQARSAVADASLQVRELARQRTLAEHQLATLTGNLELRIDVQPGSAQGVPALPAGGLPSALLERRPDVRQAEQALAAANAQIGVARAAYFPAITLSASDGGQSTALATALGSAGRIWSVGLGAATPLLDFGRTGARVDATTARRDQALAAYRKSAEIAFREVADALADVSQYRAAQRELEERAALARDTLRLADTRYKAGYSPYLEVLDAQRAANDAELAAARNRLALLNASVNLMKALGGGWSPS